jgi:hypothetical protein
MKRFRLYAAVLALGLSSASGLAVGASSASAGTTPALAAFAATFSQAGAQVRHVTTADSPDLTCPIINGEFNIYGSDCSGDIPYECSGSGYMAYDPDYVSNGCSVRVWIYETGVRAGYNLCISPHSATGLLGRAYSYAWTSSNTSSC